MMTSVFSGPHECFSGVSDVSGSRSCWEDWEEEPLLLVAVLGWRTLVAGTQTSHSPVQSRSLTIYLAEAPQQLQQPFFSLQAR